MNSISIHDTKESLTAQTHRERTTGRSPIKSINKQTLLSSGDKVYLYGDPTYTGRLIHPIERTSPPKWTVQLDCGGYEAVNIQHITVTESKQQQRSQINNNDSEDLEIPFSDPPYAKRLALGWVYPLGENRSKSRPILKAETQTPNELAAKIRSLENTIKQLEAEKEVIGQQYKDLERENQILKKDLECAKQVIRRAKDASPVMRLSLKRVLRLAHHACMDVQKTVGGWILRMGDKARSRVPLRLSAILSRLTGRGVARKISPFGRYLGFDFSR